MLQYYTHSGRSDMEQIKWTPKINKNHVYVKEKKSFLKGSGVT